MSTPPTVELLAALASALEVIGARWYLFGAQALAVHGRARHTEDVDVTVSLESATPQALLRALQSAGFEMRVDDPEAFVARTQVLPATYRPADMDLDIVLAGSGLESGFMARAELHDLGGVQVPVISAADFVVAKVLAQRPKDIEDVVSVLIAAGDAIDVGAVRALLQQLEEALDQSDLLVAFEKALRRS